MGAHPIDTANFCYISMQNVHHLIIRGRVQGVGYRESMRMEAERIGCTGWVRNRKDGSVEAVVEGPPGAVAELIEWSKRGPVSARVDSVETRDGSDGQGGFNAFEVLRTA